MLRGDSPGSEESKFAVEELLTDIPQMDSQSYQNQLIGSSKAVVIRGMRA
jgi:hypothetical protein